jgi:ABC-2 type transport system ATP-binding protein
MLDLIVRIYRTLGIAVVVSSHILEDIERVCDYVTILDSGRLVLSQPLEGLGTERGDLLVRIDGDPARLIAKLAAAGIDARLRDDLDGFPGELLVKHDDDRVFDAIRDATVDLGLPLRALRTRARSLEDIYLGNVAPEELEMSAGGTDGHA